MKINGNFATDKVTVYRFKTTVFVAKLRFLGERYRCDETNRLSRYKITVLLVIYRLKTYRYIKELPFFGRNYRFSIKLPFMHKITFLDTVTDFFS